LARIKEKNMYILEYIVLQSLVLGWFIYLIKNYPKNKKSNSYNVLFGSLSAILLLTATLIWFLVNKQSFFRELLN